MPRRGRFTRPQVRKQTRIQRKLPPSLVPSDTPSAAPGPRAERTGGQCVLVVDDDPAIVPLTIYYLATRGYRILTARSAAEGLATAHRERPDLIIVGAHLPDLPGVEVLRRLHVPGPSGAAGAPHEAVAVLLLLAGDGDLADREAERVAALALGADDVLTPPFNPQELMLRVAAILRRARGSSGGPRGVFELGGTLLLLDVDARHVTVEDVPVNLTRTEFSILQTLAEHAGRLRTRTQLSEVLWGSAANRAPRTRAVDVQVSRLRVKLGPAGHLIETVRGEGYRLRKGRAVSSEQ
ncbi:MAG TPA: response regulator transcription factor [Gemmatimonadaceae bacterium]|nr:response regulator transcription factor [Gemmatimonadaceae bacterium]